MGTGRTGSKLTTPSSSVQQQVWLKRETIDILNDWQLAKTIILLNHPENTMSVSKPRSHRKTISCVRPQIHVISPTLVKIKTGSLPNFLLAPTTVITNQFFEGGTATSNEVS